MGLWGGWGVETPSSLDGLAAVMSRNMRQGQPMLNSMAEEEHEDGDGGIDEVLLRALSRVATVTN
jgi:hypothetical protein